jgi:hypothetical protein
MMHHLFLAKGGLIESCARDQELGSITRWRLLTSQLLVMEFRFHLSTRMTSPAHGDVVSRVQVPVDDLIDRILEAKDGFNLYRSLVSSRQ